MISKARIKHLLSSSDVLKVFIGNTIGSAVYALSIVVVGRLFNKDAIGNFQLFFSVVTIFTPVAALALEKSIMLGKNRAEISKSFFISIIVLATISFILLIAFGLFGPYFFTLLKAVAVEKYYPIIILCIVFESLSLILGEVIVKEKKTAFFSINRAVTLILYGISPILLSFYSTSFMVLILSRIGGYLFSIIYFLIKGNILSLFHWYSFSESMEWLKKHKRFPLLNVPYSLVNNFSMGLPVFLLYQNFGAVEVGLFSMSYRLIQMPLSLIQNSMSDLYYREASELHNEEKELLPLFKRTVLKLFLIGLLPLPFFPFLKQIVIFGLGNSWANAALYIEILYPFFFFGFLHSMVSVTLVVIRKQEIGLLLVVLSLIARFILMKFFSSSAIAMLAAFSITGSVFYIAYNVAVYLQLKKYSRQLLIQQSLAAKPEN